MNVLIRCDGSPEIGLGHIVRCLALADDLRDSHRCSVTFALRKGPLGIRMVEGKNYQVITSREIDQNFDYGNWLNECLKKVAAQAIVMDVRDGLAIDAVKELRNEGVLIVTIDDPEDKRLEADFAFYPPIPQVKRLDWTGFTGERYVGWDWVILRPEFAAWRKKHLGPSPFTPHLSPPRILVTMGGSDPAGLTFMAVDALGMINEELKATVVTGPGFRDKEALLNKILEKEKGINVVQNPDNMAQLMSEADLAIASFGVTAYELAAMGVPAIYLCLTEDHAESASIFMKSEIAKSLGIYTQVTHHELSAAIRCLLMDVHNRLKMSKKASQLVDGRGSERIAHIIMDSLRDKK